MNVVADLMLIAGVCLAGAFLGLVGILFAVAIYLFFLFLFKEMKRGDSDK